MLLTPQFQEEWRHGREHGLRAMNPGMAARTERKHQVQDRLARYPVMNNDRAFVSPGGVADPAAIAVTLQNRFTQPPKILLVLSLQRVASRTQSQGQDLCVSAWAVHHPLSETRHFPAPLFASIVLDLTARSIVWTETPK